VTTIKIKRTVDNACLGREGLTVDGDQVIHDDRWLHPEVLTEKSVINEDRSDAYGLSKSEAVMDLAYVIDLSKAMLNKGKLIKKRVPVKGKGGKVFYRMQWVDPHVNVPGAEHTGKGESTYAHHEAEVPTLERAQSNKFPVVHHPTKDLKYSGIQNYRTDQEKYREAEKMYQKGEKLPPVRVNHKGDIISNHHLVDLAKKHGLSHVPVLVMGNTTEKKKLEDSLKDEVMVQDHDDEGKKTLVPAGLAGSGAGSNGGNSATDHPDVEQFKMFTSKKYTKKYIMDEARRQGIKWIDHTKAGESLEKHPAILWKNAYMAITDHIRQGNKFELSHSEKDVDKRMEQEGNDSVHKHFLTLLEKHGSKQNLMEWAKKNGILWKEKSDPQINWMYAATAIKNELAKGHMVDGVRTRQKGAMDEAHLVVSDQIKAMIAGYGQKYGKSKVMSRADELGIQYERFTKDGSPLPDNSPILWMRASTAISTYVAKGNTFSIGEDDPDSNGIISRVGDFGTSKLSRMQQLAVNLGKRNSQNFELKAKNWAFKSLKVDYAGTDGNEPNVEDMYNKLMEGARNAKILIHFDPLEALASGVNLADQLSSEGKLKNNWELGKVGDVEAMEINERELFDVDYDETPKRERPHYGVVDLFNQGLKSAPYGEVAFVLKDDLKKRTTGTHTDSNNLEYETNGKLTRSMEDPHHLIVDRWKTRWNNPNKKDLKRKRFTDALISGGKTGYDGEYFEAHVHGGVDLRNDVDHILVPSSWQTDDSHKEKHDKLQSLAKLMNLSIKYEGTSGTSNTELKSGDISK